ncbi:MAG: hypothetical protein SGILL_010247, partial [Bacillariaceae sp.]
ALEAKPTKATIGETFSGDHEFDYDCNQPPGHTFSTEEHHNLHSNNFINLAEEQQYQQQQYHGHGGTFDTYDDHDRIADEDCRDDYLSNEDNNLAVSSTYSSDAEFINIAQEAAAIPSRHYRSSVVNMQQDDFESYAESYGLEEEKLQHADGGDEDGTMLRFIDSEDGQAFSFRTPNPQGYGDVKAMPYITEEHGDGDHTPRTYEDLHQNPSLEATSVGYDSKTLNTNCETLHTDLEGVNYIPTMNEHDVVHDPAYQLDGEGESYDDDEARLAGGFEDIYDNTQNNAAGVSIPQTSSYQYEEDGYIRYNEDDHHPHHQGQHHDELRQQNTFQDTITEFTKDEATHARLETRDDEVHDAHSSQLMDSYLSDRSSESWDEGSYTSKSRGVSRMDSFGDRTEFTEDTRRDNGVIVHMLKNFRDNVQDYRDGNDLDSINEEDEDDSESRYHERASDKKKRSGRRGSRRNPRRDIGEVLGQLGDIGIDLLNETIDKAERVEKGSKNRRRSRGRRSEDPAEKLINSFRDMFSCGAPRHY